MKTYYTTSVIGRAWAGFKATYQYKTDNFPQNIKALAGDFQEVLDYQVDKTSFTLRVEQNKTITTTTVEIIRPWEHQESEDFFIDCAA